MRLKYLLTTLSITIKKSLNKNLNPFYRDVRFLADIEGIVKELNKHESMIIEEHKKLIELNRVTKEISLLNNQELKDDILNFISSSDKWSYLKDDIEYIKIESKTFSNKALELNKEVLFTVINNGVPSIVLNLEVIDFIFRSYLYSVCEASSKVGLHNVYYYDHGKLKPLSYFFNKLMVDLRVEYKHLLKENIALNQEAFFLKYGEKYLEHISKNILGKKHFKII